MEDKDLDKKAYWKTLIAGFITCLLILLVIIFSR